MENYLARAFTWDDVQRVASKIKGWKGIPPGGSTPALFLHQFGELVLALESPAHEICGVIACTIAPNYRGSAMIQTLLVDGALIGTGAIRFFLNKVCGAAKEIGCDRMIAAIPAKSRSFVQIFTLSDFIPVLPPENIKADEPFFHQDSHSAGKETPLQKDKSGIDMEIAAGQLWKDYFGAGEHAVVLVREI